MKPRGPGQDLRVTLISSGSIPGKRDIELQSETRTWAVFGCTLFGSILSPSARRCTARVYGRRPLAGFTKRMHDAAAAAAAAAAASWPDLCLLLFLLLVSALPPDLRFALLLARRRPLRALLPPLDISGSEHNSNPGGLYARRGNSSVATRSGGLIEISYPLT